MIYGIGAQALGEQLAVSGDEASVFMESFKAKFTGISLTVNQSINQSINLIFKVA